MRLIPLFLLATPAHSASCSFESQDGCGAWTSVASSGTWSYGKSSMFGTDEPTPVPDGQYYAYVEWTSNRNGQTSIDEATVSPTEAAVLTFSYALYDAWAPADTSMDVGELRIWAASQEVWLRELSHTKQWLAGKVFLGAFSDMGPIQLLLHFTKGPGIGEGGIGKALVDSLELKNVTLAEVPAACGFAAAADAAGEFCGFWRDDSTQLLNAWSHQGASGANGAGSGYLLSQSPAVLRSGPLKLGAGETILSFWYKGDLAVSFAGAQKWSETGTAAWQYAEVQLGGAADLGEVTLECGSGQCSLDEISAFHHTSTETGTSSTSTSRTQTTATASTTSSTSSGTSTTSSSLTSTTSSSLTSTSTFTSSSSTTTSTTSLTTTSTTSSTATMSSSSTTTMSSSRTSTTATTSGTTVTTSSSTTSTATSSTSSSATMTSSTSETSSTSLTTSSSSTTSLTSSSSTRTTSSSTTTESMTVTGTTLTVSSSSRTMTSSGSSSSSSSTATSTSSTAISTSSISTSGSSSASTTSTSITGSTSTTRAEGSSSTLSTLSSSLSASSTTIASTSTSSSSSVRVVSTGTRTSTTSSLTSSIRITPYTTSSSRTSGTTTDTRMRSTTSSTARSGSTGPSTAAHSTSLGSITSSSFVPESSTTSSYSTSSTKTTSSSVPVSSLTSSSTTTTVVPEPNRTLFAAQELLQGGTADAGLMLGLLEALAGLVENYTFTDFQSGLWGQVALGCLDAAGLSAALPLLGSASLLASRLDGISLGTGQNLLDVLGHLALALPLATESLSRPERLGSAGQLVAAARDLGWALSESQGGPVGLNASSGSLQLLLAEVRQTDAARRLSACPTRSLHIEWRGANPFTSASSPGLYVGSDWPAASLELRSCRAQVLRPVELELPLPPPGQGHLVCVRYDENTSAWVQEEASAHSPGTIRCVSRWGGAVYSVARVGDLEVTGMDLTLLLTGLGSVAACMLLVFCAVMCRRPRSGRRSINVEEGRCAKVRWDLAKEKQDGREHVVWSLDGKLLEGLAAPPDMELALHDLAGAPFKSSSGASEATEAFEPRTAFSQGDCVEVFCRREMCWLPGTVQVLLDAAEQKVSYRVRLPLSQVLQDVPLDQLRPVLQAGEAVEVLQRKKDGGCAWRQAEIGGCQSRSCTTLGYSVELREAQHCEGPQAGSAVAAHGQDTSVLAQVLACAGSSLLQPQAVSPEEEEQGRKLLSRVPATRLRRAFPQGASVEVYSGWQSGWRPATVLETLPETWQLSEQGSRAHERADIWQEEPGKGSEPSSVTVERSEEEAREGELPLRPGDLLELSFGREGRDATRPGHIRLYRTPAQLALLAGAAAGDHLHVGAVRLEVLEKRAASSLSAKVLTGGRLKAGSLTEAASAKRIFKAHMDLWPLLLVQEEGAARRAPLFLIRSRTEAPGSHAGAQSPACGPSGGAFP